MQTPPRRLVKSNRDVNYAVFCVTVLYVGMMKPDDLYASLKTDLETDVSSPCCYPNDKGLH